MKIRSVGVRANPNPRSAEIAGRLSASLAPRGLSLDNAHPDLWIAVGGDGSFLSLASQTGYDPGCLYVGIHTGTLGFLQEVDPADLEDFLDQAAAGTLEVEKRDLQVTRVFEGAKETVIKALNEAVIRDRALKAINLQIRIDGELLEEFAGDGLLVATSVGSTAYNLSFRGALVDSELSVMQLTPIAPLTNKHYHNLLDPVIVPGCRAIEIIPDRHDLIVTADGISREFASCDRIAITLEQAALSCLLYKNTGFVAKVREKLLK